MIPQFMTEKYRAPCGDQTQCLLIEFCILALDCKFSGILALQCIWYHIAKRLP